MRRMTIASMTALALLAGAGCGDEAAKPAPEPTPEVEQTLVDEARAQMPTMTAMHTQIFKRTCSPDSGVCHNTKEFPDLHTPGNLLDAIGKPCNLAEEPENVDDMCEPPGDLLTIDSGPARGFSARIATHAIVDGDWIIQLAAPIEGCEAHRAAFTITDGGGTGEVIIEAPNQALFVACGSPEVRVGNIAVLGPEVVAGIGNRIRRGDPNGNGVLGADEAPGVQIWPSEPERSYLLSRTLGIVSGTRMPLANQPLSDAEHLAFICWIETLDDDPSEDDPIRYDACEAARAVIETGSLDLPEATEDGQ